ncbi:MAG TPA: hypothetical protein VHB50_11385 [Bryobacteraceae bacterium]|nr:hypothetical protein [Bryobacteraceae bacterium]
MLVAARATGQEASSGFDLRTTLSGVGALGEDSGAGFRAVFYPTWKINEHWSASGAWQVNSRHYFLSNLGTSGDGVKGYLLNGSLNYSRASDSGSLVIRVGQLTTAFGSFLLRYDDADNPLIDLPGQYGYYYAAVSSLGVAGAQIDATRGKWDGRVQFANSSPANPRSVFASDQYANWAGGGGVTIRQGFRIGASAYRGPYLARNSRFFRHGEANPKQLPARAIGVDVQWASGHWNAQGEWQKFTMPYRAVPDFHEQAAYAELKRVLHPRWYVAARCGYVNASAGEGDRQIIEAVAGFRPGVRELVKAGYEITHYMKNNGAVDKVFAVELVTQIHPLSLARN